MNVKLIVKENDMSEIFQEETVHDYKVKFSKDKILKNLETEVMEKFDNNNLSASCLIDYDTTGDKHCIFQLIEFKRLEDDNFEITYEFDTTIS